jgi:tripartite-type tricarboxylate transporter receptor subunit TctC
MPPAVVKQLNESLATVLTAPDMREKLAVEAVEPMPMTPEKFLQFIKADIARWTRVARERSITLDS